MRRIRAMRWILAALVVAFLAAGCGGAPPSDISGELASIDASNRSIEVRGADGESGVYYLDGDTKIMSGSQTLAFSDLALGSQVVVDAESKGGRMVATYVELVGN